MQDTVLEDDIYVPIEVDKEEAYQLGKVDFDFFSSLLLPTVCTAPWPPMYIAMWKLVIQRDDAMIGEILRLALGLPRGFAKTTFVKLLLAYLIVYDLVHFILVVAANEGLASNIIKDISDMLGDPQVESVYGAWFNYLSTDNATEKVCFYHGKKLILYALGSNAGVRGINKGNRRPDFILCDDVQTKECDKSEVESERLKTWLIMSMFKCLETKGDRTIAYLGNMYSEQCMLYQFKNMSEWTSLITGAILASGESLWEAVHTIASILKGYYHDEKLGLSADWFAEIMNDPQASYTSLLKGELHMYPHTLDMDDISAAFVVVDPAGYRVTSDDNVFTTYGIVEGRLVILEMGGDKWEPKQLIEEIFASALKWSASVIGIESVAYQQTLCYWTEQALIDLHMEDLITVVELKPHGRSKESRMREFLGECTGVRLEKGVTVVGDPTITFLRAEDKSKVTWYANKYRIGVKDNQDDWIDCPAYGLDMRKEYGSILGLISQRKKRKRGKRIRINTKF